jgi:DNA-binding NarL/FixJ family response regulator
MRECIRVLLVDDQMLVREGLRRLLELELDFEVVGAVAGGEDALAIVERLYAAGTPPTVILVDIRMPGIDGITTTKRLKKNWPDAHIVILTTFDNPELIHAGLQAGAQGYLLKDSTPENLALTVRLAAHGQVLLQPDIASKAFSPLPSSVADNPPPVTLSVDNEKYTEPLSEREREILALLAQGASNRLIAERLYLREGTIKNYVSGIISKLRVQDRTQAALKARELGFL